jgi:hypothetical protein
VERSIADHSAGRTTEVARRERKPGRRTASARSVIQEAKVQVQTIDLADLLAGAGNMQGEAVTAAAEVLQTFGHPIPPRPARWHAKQSRQEKTRRAIEEAKVRRVQRRIYRWILAPPLVNIEDEDEQRSEERRAWDDAGYIARLLVSRAGEVAA